MSATFLTVKVHPVVLFQIVDAYDRKQANSQRVIGTLLGSVDEGVVEVKNCFCVPHRDLVDSVEADLSYDFDMYNSNKKAYPNEIIVGWWATGNEVTGHSALIHDYYEKQCNNPVHLTVDTSLQGERMSFKAFVRVKLGVPGGTMGYMFSKINVDVISYEPELLILKLFQKAVAASNPNEPKTVSPVQDLAKITEILSTMQSLLKKMLSYVEDVINGKQEADNAVGRSLFDLINSVPKVTSEQFTQTSNFNISDVLILSRLSEILAAQVKLKEKLEILKEK